MKSDLIDVIGVLATSVGLIAGFSGGPSVTKTFGCDSETGFVEDIDGNRYRTVRIGTQVWMADNLETTRYLDGSSIPSSMNPDTWSAGSIGASCLPEGGSEASNEAYGLLYNFAAISDSRGLCPEGWHVPTADEWRTLIDYLGGPGVAGGRLRDVGSDLWRSGFAGANDSSGFSAVPAGGRGRYGEASDLGFYATWWSATSEDEEYAWHWGLHPDRNSIRFNPGHKSSGFSVRCVQD